MTGHQTGDSRKRAAEVASGATPNEVEALLEDTGGRFDRAALGERILGLLEAAEMRGHEKGLLDPGSSWMTNRAALRAEGAQAETLTDTIRATSRAISGSYPDGLDPEAHMWRRCMKVCEEVGEATEALLGYLGENPRKGETHSLSDLVAELLDVANAALGAVDHLVPDEDPVALLTQHSASRWHRLRAALTEAGGE